MTEITELKRTSTIITNTQNSYTQASKTNEEIITNILEENKNYEWPKMHSRTRFLNGNQVENNQISDLSLHTPQNTKMISIPNYTHRWYLIRPI